MQEIGPEEAHRRLDDAVLLDVREPWEWRAGHVEGAVHIPLGSLPARVDELDGDAPVVVACRSGGRSAQATAWLDHNGFDAANLDGGMEAWHEAGLPLVDDGGGPGEVA